MKHKPSYQRIVRSRHPVTRVPHYAFLLRCSCGFKLDQAAPKRILKQKYLEHVDASDALQREADDA